MISGFKTISFLALTLTACGNRRRAEPLPTSQTYLSAQASGAPRLAIRTIEGSEAESQMARNGVELANRIMRSECFEALINKAAFTETGGLTSKEVWQRMSTTVVTLRVVFYDGSFIANRIFKTIGFEDESTPDVVYMNRYFVKSPTDVADNMIHEGEGHTLGFRHDHHKSTSVPYQLNRIFRRCLRETAKT